MKNVNKNISITDCNRIPISENIDFSEFDCGCNDLNDFIKNDAINYASQLLATTYIYLYENSPVAFVSYLNDKISYSEDIDGNKLSRKIKNIKRTKSGYPAVKIGRLGVDVNYQRYGLGTQIIDFSKMWFLDANKTGCRFITLDAYNLDKTINFYKNNGFKFLLKKNDQEENARTVLMYFDLITIS